MEVTIGRLKTHAVVDTGWMANMISAALAKETGLSATRVPDKALDVHGVAGQGVRCETWIARLTICVTEEKIPAYSALFIVEGTTTFDVILGMPWIGRHGGTIAQKERGSYLSWMSGADRYEMEAY